MYPTAASTEAIIPKAGEDNLDFAVTRRWGIWTGRCFRLSLGVCRERGGPRLKLASVLPPACKHIDGVILVATVTTLLLTTSFRLRKRTCTNTEGTKCYIPSWCWNSLSVTDIDDNALQLDSITYYYSSVISLCVLHWLLSLFQSVTIKIKDLEF